MKNIQNKKKIQIMIFVLIAVIALGVGYAAITAINLVIEAAVSTSITGTLTASPLENANATGSASASVTPAPPIVAPAYKYSISSNNIGQALVGEQPSFAAAKTAFGHPVATAHIITGGVIEKSYVAFERNGTVYYLRGGAGNEFGQQVCQYMKQM